MNFLFPLFALAAAAVAIPILLHFRRQPPQKVVPFSSLMFLEQTPVPPKTRRKLEDWLLLALRCLALILLALMFSRPFVRSQKTAFAEGGVSWCILVDTSASMHREEVWEQVEEKYGVALEQVGEADALLVATFDDHPRLLLDHEAWEKVPVGTRRVAAASLLQDVEPTWAGTNLGEALVFAAQQLSSEGTGKHGERRIVLISDVQEGAALEALQSTSWPEHVIVDVDPVEAPWKNNFTLTAAPPVTEEAAASLDAVPSSMNREGQGQVRVRVTNSRDSEVEKFSLQWSTSGDVVEATVPSGGSRILNAPARSELATDGQLNLRGDGESLDNHLFVAKPIARPARVVCVGQGLSRNETVSPLFYLERALKPTAAFLPELVVTNSSELRGVDLQDADVVMLFGEAPEAAREILQNWVKAGGALLAVAASGDRGDTLRALGAAPEVKLKDVEEDALLQDLDFSHPLLRTFAESGVRDFTRIRFWKHRTIEGVEGMKNAAVIARFEGGSPAWVEWPLEKGRVLAMMAGWQPSDSQLAVASKFVPLLYSLLDWAQGSELSAQSLVVGDAIAAQPSWKGVLPVKRPDGRTENWNVDAEKMWHGTDMPGIYVVGTGDAARSVAVNLAPNEGRLAPMDMQRLADAGVKLKSTGASAMGTKTEAEEAAAERRVEDSEHEQRQKGWKVLLLAALLVLFLETWLAGRRSRGVQMRSQPTTQAA
ncbi:putative membrane protein (TIGR02226 family) [Roseimicrobium gellanilyticum]|uniref:Putative membrane protein (TIGR02226 family) n=1 Tax=Roseimicrobium gellanilyticum TaxID=748857 RepID=A0A366HUE8_9BACT|nr:VWA domain-containing protein [Roseimicrobium gellanilyticum]RBP47911.1 putative membrane protein (TIGR02226 family) [Roseimicrobium gellanilyticum]